MEPTPDLLERMREVRIVALDADGVLTDGMLWYGAQGEVLKAFHVQDGLGIQRLMDAGIQVAVISARSSEPLARRVAELGIPHFRPNTRNKLDGLKEVLEPLGIGLHQVCYVGDDLIDIPALRAVGFAASVADAHPTAREAAHWVSSKPGGRGAVRQVSDMILGAQSKSRFGIHKEDSKGNFGIIIPARWGSTRLPGKPLIDIAGKPLILRVVDNAKEAGADFVTVATDDDRIFQVVKEAGGSAVMTSPDHASGTDRLAEVVSALGLRDDAMVVNVQGDEPMVDPAWVRGVAHALRLHSTNDSYNDSSNDPTVGMATVATPIHQASDLFDPNVVKVITDRNGIALTFTRAPIPWSRGTFVPTSIPSSLPEGPIFLRHMGLYAYRTAVLRALASQPPVALEQAESLEQLRALWLGIRIHVTVVQNAPGRGVDTQEDLREVRRFFEKGNANG